MRLSPQASHVLRAAAATVALLLCASLIAPAASAADQGYRFWSFWSGDGSSWQPLSTGAGDHKLADRAVFGAKLVVTGDSLQPSDAPGQPPNYDTLCPDSSGGTGIHVALVIDFGSKVDAPKGEKPPASQTDCLTLPESSTAAAALQAAASVRAGEGGMICGINGYPATECSVAVAEIPDKPEPSASPADSPAESPAAASSENRPPWWLAAAVGALLIILIALAVMRGRSRGSNDDGAIT
ncbi:MAG: SCO2322 family protein [Candidatus Nanopelagicales bacterium]|nr:SCO2322 family protein [Candidatus Nanopelagicales bacterium]